MKLYRGQALSSDLTPTDHSHYSVSTPLCGMFFFEKSERGKAIVYALSNPEHISNNEGYLGDDEYVEKGFLFECNYKGRDDYFLDDIMVSEFPNSVEILAISMHSSLNLPETQDEFINRVLSEHSILNVIELLNETRLESGLPDRDFLLCLKPMLDDCGSSLSRYYEEGELIKGEYVSFDSENIKILRKSEIHKDNFLKGDAAIERKNLSFEKTVELKVKMNKRLVDNSLSGNDVDLNI